MEATFAPPPEPEAEEGPPPVEAAPGLPLWKWSRVMRLSRISSSVPSQTSAASSGAVVRKTSSSFLVARFDSFARDPLQVRLEAIRYREADQLRYLVGMDGPRCL